MGRYPQFRKNSSKSAEIHFTLSVYRYALFPNAEKSSIVSIQNARMTRSVTDCGRNSTSSSVGHEPRDPSWTFRQEPFTTLRVIQRTDRQTIATTAKFRVFQKTLIITTDKRCNFVLPYLNLQGGPKKRGHSTFSQISRKLLKTSKWFFAHIKARLSVCRTWHIHTNFSNSFYSVAPSGEYWTIITNLIMQHQNSNLMVYLL